MDQTAIVSILTCDDHSMLSMEYFFTVEVLVPPPRLVITPSTITTVSVSSPTNSPSVTPTLNVIPTPIEKSDDTELSVGALVGIIFGGIIVIIIVVCLATLLIYVVKVR